MSYDNTTLQQAQADLQAAEDYWNTLIKSGTQRELPAAARTARELHAAGYYAHASIGTVKNRLRERVDAGELETDIFIMHGARARYYWPVVKP